MHQPTVVATKASRFGNIHKTNATVTPDKSQMPVLFNFVHELPSAALPRRHRVCMQRLHCISFLR